jgi:hypothetical protein
MKLLSIKRLQAKLRMLNLIDDKNSPVLYSTFKNKASIHRYKGRTGTLKIVFIGKPKENLIGFYAAFKNDTDVNVMREAYSNLCLIAKGDIFPHESQAVQWGNAGIPITFGNLRVVENKFGG